MDPTGIWQLQISDQQSGDQGTFISACLRLEVATDCDGDGVPDDCSCQGDLDGDGVVGGADLAAMLGYWGTNDPAADLDGDELVGGADLSRLLGNWGSCNCPAESTGIRVPDPRAGRDLEPATQLNTTTRSP